MKNISLIFFFFSLTIYCQKTYNGEIIYQDSFKTASNNIISSYTLYFNNNFSFYILNTKAIPIKNNANGTLSSLIPEQSLKKPFYYKELNKENVIFNSKTLLRQYTVNDNALKFNWKIHNDERIIGKHTCRKATTEFRGRKYTAWFTSEIPVDYGPRKFNGLPGLILEIYDEKRIYRAYAKNLKINSGTENFEKLLTDINLSNSITYKEFLSKRCDDAIKFKSLISSKMPRGSGNLKLNKVGSSENLEINSDVCLD